MALNRLGGAWKGGYISIGARGRKTWVIERRVNGDRYHVSTRCHDERAAFRHLDRFESNPNAYRPEGDEVLGPLHIAATDIQRYITWTRTAKGNSREHAREVNRYLTHWLGDLGRADWRRLKLMELKAVLDKRKTCRAPRIAAIKAFCTWLREEEGALTSEQDATRDLACIQATPEKMRREKKVSRAVVQSVLAELPAVARDFVLVKACTGLHSSEIRRIIRGDNAVLEELDETAAKAAGCPAVMRFLHKKKKLVVKRVETRQLLDALRRLIAVRFVKARDVNEAVAAACTKLELEPFTIGVLRHSWGTWHVEGGATIQAVADGYGHESKRTTERFYIQVAVPNATLPAVAFELPSDVVH